MKFQQIGFAYAVLGDEKRRERYDKTGKTDEGLDFGVGEDGWEAYFEELFERVTREKLDELKIKANILAAFVEQKVENITEDAEEIIEEAAERIREEL